MEIPLKASPSLSYQNLSYGDGKFAYLHNTEVHLLNVATKETSSIRIKDKIYQAKICTVNGANVLVLSTQGGTQFCDLGKEKHIFTVAHSEEGSFLNRGLAAVRSSVFVGHALGTISVIEVAGDRGTVVKTLSDHKDAITDIASGTIEEQTIVASADMAGVICLRAQDGNPLARVAAPAGDTVTSLAITPCHVVGAFGSGKICLYTVLGKKAVEVCAHSRWVNSIDYCAATNSLASVSEDMLLQFWKMPSKSDPKVAMKGSKLLKDCLLTGVKFLDDGSHVGCTAYDTDKFFFYQA
mmetsp:Transcript_132026/g.228817  ORF Transcript_132026/g.228817 Transcript_132026/m.228817 type:complete len:296 (-) Transcript_132026:229-1116(-)